VVAAAGGRVAAVQAVGADYGREPAGWEVAVDHSGGWVTRYRFSGTVRVRQAERVARGQPLGTLTAPGVHFALYRDGEALPPPAAAPSGG
jgi:murein DD-endopeptidase MepM/ murein hydrolase activator NlpD